MKVPHPRLTYANVTATLCLFLLLGGGAYAATELPKNSVGTKQLKKGSVTAAKVKSGSLLASDFKSGQLPAGAPGSPGAPGAPGVTTVLTPNVVTRYGAERALETAHGNSSYAGCHTGEAVTGGGYEFVEGSPSTTSYVIGADRPSTETTPTIHPAPLDGTKATGWLVFMENATGSTFKFRAYAQCASP
jgi:hypothetical protein